MGGEIVGGGGEEVEGDRYGGLNIEGIMEPGVAVKTWIEKEILVLLKRFDYG